MRFLWSSPVFFGLAIIGTGCGCGPSKLDQKTGLNQTFKHYSLIFLSIKGKWRLYIGKLFIYYTEVALTPVYKCNSQPFGIYCMLSFISCGFFRRLLLLNHAVFPQSFLFNLISSSLSVITLLFWGSFPWPDLSQHSGQQAACKQINLFEKLNYLCLLFSLPLAEIGQLTQLHQDSSYCTYPSTLARQWVFFSLASFFV